MSVPSGVALLAELEGQARRGYVSKPPVIQPKFIPIDEQDWKTLDHISMALPVVGWMNNLQKSLAMCGFEIVKKID
jgi:hypothetical protein